MPIAHQHKTIFVHIPKTGGKSIEYALGVFGSNNKGGNRKNDEILYGYQNDSNKALQHLTALEIKSVISNDVYNAYFKFAIVRNPYDRVISEYFWVKQLSMNMSFKDFLVKKIQPNKNLNSHYMEQYKFITDENGNIIVDFVGKFENFNKDLRYVLNKLGLNKKILHMNKTKPLNFIHYSDYYNEETKNLVKQIYEKDIAMFSYEFETLNFISRTLKKIPMVKNYTIISIKSLIKKIPWLYALLKRLLYRKKMVYGERLIFISKPSCSNYKIMTTRILPRRLKDEFGKLKFDQRTFSGISGRCDWIMLEPNLIVGDPKKPPKTVFISMRPVRVSMGTGSGTVLSHFYNKVLTLVQNKIVLLTGSNDFTIPNQIDKRFTKLSFAEKKFFYKILNDKRIIHWFAENHDEVFEKMSTLPSGVSPRTCMNFNPDCIWDFTNISTPISRRPLRVICADILREGPQWENRRKVAKLSQTAWKDFSIYLHNRQLEYDEWLKFVARYPFLLCVQGGGIDPAPKAWEAIVVGTIPIIKHSPLDDAYSQFPVVFIDEWVEEAISHEKLKKWLSKLSPFYKNGSKERKEVLKRLTTDYWWNKVESKLYAASEKNSTQLNCN